MGNPSTSIDILLIAISIHLLMPDPHELGV